MSATRRSFFDLFLALAQPPAPAKFSARGEPLPFAGNTILCPLPAGHPYSQFQQTLRAWKSLAVLPEASLHMTVFDGVLDHLRTPPLWPSDLPANAPLDACHNHFDQALANLPFPSLLHLDFQAFHLTPATIAIALTPPSDSPLRNLRNLLSTTLKIRRPNHDAYQFHITLASVLTQPPPPLANLLAAWTAQLRQTTPQLSLHAAYFCTFPNLTNFYPRRRLPSRPPLE